MPPTAARQGRGEFKPGAGHTAAFYNLAMPFWSNPTTTRPPTTITGRRIKFGSRAISRMASLREGGWSFIFFCR